MEKNNLGCGKKMRTGNLCGIANAWGKEYLCLSCNKELRLNWKKEENLKK